MKLIEGWKKSYKFLSVQIGLLGTLVMGFLTIFPDAIVFAWNLVPLELRNTIPPRLYMIIGVVLFVAAVLARLIHQPKAAEAIEEAALKEQIKKAEKEA